MENGNDVVGESFVGEKKSIEGRIPEEKMEERVLAGFDESKEMEEDVFEEAIGTQEHLQEKGTKSELGNDGLVVGSSALVVDDENPKARNETEDFEEAIGGPGVDGNAEEVTVVSADEKTENLVLQDGASGVVLPDKIDEGGTEIEVETNELYVEKGAPEIGVHGDTEVLKTRDETDVKSVLIGKAENDDFVSSLLERTPVNKNPDSEDGDIVVGSDLVSHVEVELDGEVLLEDGKTKKLNEYTLVTEHGDVSGGESVDGSNGTHSGPQRDNGEELNNELAKVDAKHKDKEFGVLECATVNLDSEDVDDKSNEVRGTLDGINVEHQVNQSNDVRDPSAESQTTVDELTGARGTGSSTSLEKSTAEQNGELQAVTADSEAGNYVSSGPASAGEKVNEAHNHRAVGEEHEKIEEKDLEKKPSTQVNRESENMPAPDRASSSAKSVNPAPPARPAGLGRAAPLLEPGPRVAQQPRVNGTVSHTQTHQIEEPATGEADENDETREKLQMIRVKFLRLAHRLGQTPHNVVVAQVLYRLGLAEQLRGRNGGRVGAFSFDRASAMAEQLEAAGQEPLDFSCTIMVLGKTGVGKSATINSIFDEVKFSTDAFQMGTKKVQDVVGTVQGIKVRVIDTPGLLPSWSEQHQNEKILHSVKRFIKKTPPDIVLYLDRLDMQSRDFGDMPLLRTITEIFGPSIWFNAIVVLTHAASAPPDGPNGTASSYDMFVTQRSHVVQQAIRQAAGDMRLMNPVSLVENHSACRTNRAGQRVLPNGQVWKPHLLLLSFASKILAEANALLKLQDSPPGKPFAARSRAPPLPFLLSSLLQSRPQVKLPEEQFGDEDDMDEDLDESSDSDDESEYDQLPPFKRLTKTQMSKLTKVQKEEYLNELEYREKLFMKKQLKEERKRRKMMKKMAAMTKDLQSDYGENVEDETGGAASVPVPMPDLALPASFDSDNPTHRYRYLDSSNQWLVRPVLETHGWDHDVGYEGINVERVFAIKDKVPVSFSGQVTKDKKDANVQMELASSIKHGEGKATSLGFDMQTVGKDLAYTLRSEMRLSNFRKNKATAGLSVTLLGDALSAGVKVEDKLIANKQFRLVVTGGAMAGRGDVAYGGSLEAQLRDKDYPLGRFLSTLGLSVMDWHGDLAIGGNMQSQVPIGRSMNLIARANLNNRGAGQVSIRLNSSEHLQIAYLGLLPLLRKLLGYSQQMQFGQ